jgi:formiminotetrahydrofolate cyclodeaminase
MVGRYSLGGRYADHAEVVDRVVATADELRETALGLAEADAAACAAVAEAYALAKETGEEKARRSRAIADALAGAAGPPADTIGHCRRALELAETLLPIGNRNVITDVAAAAEAIRAAATTSRVNVLINLGGVTDTAVRDRCAAALADVDDIAARAEAVTRTVVEEIK